MNALRSPAAVLLLACAVLFPPGQPWRGGGRLNGHLSPTASNVTPSGSSIVPPRSIFDAPVQMVTPTVGWFFGFLSIARTTDGGRTWRRVTPPSMFHYYDACSGNTWDYRSASGAVAVSGSEAVDAEWCMNTANGGDSTVTVWRTFDGGRTWRSAAISHRLYDPAGSLPLLFGLEFVSPTVGWLGPASVQSSFSWGPVLATRNAGATGSEASVTGDGMQGAGGTVLGFVSPERGYAYGYSNQAPPTTTEPGLPDLSVFPYVTDNGGRTWWHPKVPAPPGYFPDGRQKCPSNGCGFIHVGTPGFSGPRSAAIPVMFEHLGPYYAGQCADCLSTTYHTTDGGAHWWHTRILSGVGLARSGWQTYFLDATHGWTVGTSDETGQPQAYRTTDGGEHWAALAGDHVLTDAIAYDGLQFVTPRVGFAFGVPGDKCALWRTDDAGSAWHCLTSRLPWF